MCQYESKREVSEINEIRIYNRNHNVLNAQQIQRNNMTNQEILKKGLKWNYKRISFDL
ncbi:hypothetical protein LCGC14_0066210 [marine sediment metagenome]|uniref:Uncharacterized protein n=1 Tax=marine sediment metagenome TaxID=412755 RepID=A0A0F9W1U9_9ZZZZ